MAARRSRKRRKKQRRSGGERPRPEPAAAGYARVREKDAEARARLEPLRPGERPRAVTVAAVVAALLALANLGSYVLGVEIQGRRPSIVGVVAYSGLMLLAAWGMWRARYWAVLGMQALLGLIILVFAVLAIRFENVGELAIALVIIAAAGTLFWFLVKAMARIQMPKPPSARS